VISKWRRNQNIAYRGNMITLFPWLAIATPRLFTILKLARKLDGMELNSIRRDPEPEATVSS
jgi:hypothetical protein